jgi:penicillin-binding protein 1A
MPKGKNDSGKKPKQEKSKRRNVIRKAILTIWFIFLLGILSFVGLMYGVANDFFGELPSFEQLENPKSHLATEIYSSDGVLLGKFFRENRSNVDYENLSPVLIDALIATEDRRYYEHAGIDYKGLVRAVVNFGKAGGASTLTQQLAKNLFHKRPRTKTARILQKLKEWIIAVRLEKSYTKEEILTMYLNTVEFVNNAIGIKSAAKVYFNTVPDSLNVEQSALLVGMVKNPSKYNPIRFADRSKFRRNIVIDQMAKYDYITDSLADDLKQLDLEIDYQKVDHNQGMAPYFREKLRMFMKEWASKTKKPDGTNAYDIYSDGLKIYTTIDSRIQKYAEDAMLEYMPQLQKQFDEHWGNIKKDPWNYRSDLERYNPDFLEDKMKISERYRKLKKQGVPEDSIKMIFNTPIPMKVFDWKAEGYEKDTVFSPLDSIRYFNFFLQSGMMVADPYTGEILAWVGGYNHKYFQLDHVTTKRQVGSTFKPFVYTTAINELGYSPCQMFPNVDYPNPKFNNWAPRNSGDYKEGENIALWDALAHSVNKITAKLMLDIDDPQNVINLIRQMGITSYVPPYPSIALGTCDLTLKEMVGSYTTFVNYGIYSKPLFITRIEDKYGNVIARFTPESKEVLNPEVSHVMIDILKKVVDHGTARRLRYKYKFESEIAGKTGTTQENTDGWFMGVIPDLVAGVWVGGDDPVFRFRYTSLGQGAHMALPIYALFLQRIYADESLGISKEAKFPELKDRQTIELDCDKYKESNRNSYDEL